MTAFIVRLSLAFSLLLPAATVSAQSSVMVVDQSNKKVHVAANANTKRAVGGMAKIATALVVLDWSEASNVSLNVLARVPEYAGRIAGDGANTNNLGLGFGDDVTLRDLLYATMMGSDNVAAITLGHFVGQDMLTRKGQGGDPLEEFVKQMNALAAREGCKNTKFMNPHGLENSRPQPYSTAADVARLTLYGISRPAFVFYANQASRPITIYRGGGQRVSQKLTNTNQLLGSMRIDGVKVSSTPLSGGCLAVSADKDATVVKQADGSSLIYRHRMVVIVLGSPDPFTEARGLLSQGWRVYDEWLRAGRPVGQKEQLLQNF